MKGILRLFIVALMTLTFAGASFAQSAPETPAVEKKAEGKKVKKKGEGKAKAKAKKADKKGETPAETK